MLSEILIKIFERDLAKLKNEVEQYTDAADMWLVSDDIPNSGGTLALHIVGNLKHFVGAVIGNSGYVRQRDNEFSALDVPREEILGSIDELRHEVAAVLGRLSDEDLNEIYPIEVFGEPMATGYFLTHLATHLSYHLGQLNYHRRLLGKRLKGETQLIVNE